MLPVTVDGNYCHLLTIVQLLKAWICNYLCSICRLESTEGCNCCNIELFNYYNFCNIEFSNCCKCFDVIYWNYCNCFICWNCPLLPTMVFDNCWQLFNYIIINVLNFQLPMFNQQSRINWSSLDPHLWSCWICLLYYLYNFIVAL